VLDADIRDFFGSLTHEWLVKFVEHRIGDKRVVRLIQKWLAAGVLEDGKRVRSEVGTVQGGSVSPLLANIYLHYVLDLWAQQWRKTQAQGDMVIVRFADDFVVGFEHRQEAERFLAELRERFVQFLPGAASRQDTAHRIWPPCDKNRRDRGDGKPESFNFLGFHATSAGKPEKAGSRCCGRRCAKGGRQKFRPVRIELKRRFARPRPGSGRLPALGRHGALRYYGVPMNGPALGRLPKRNRSHLAMDA